MSYADDEGLVTLLRTGDPVAASRLVDLLESQRIAASVLNVTEAGWWYVSLGIPPLRVLVLARDLREREQHVAAALAQLREELGFDPACIAW